MPSRQAALLRGINVGRANRVAMADLRSTFEGLGCVDVRTVLNSGNVVFTSKSASPTSSARIEKAIAARLGVSTRVTVLTAEEFAAIVAGNPLLPLASDPSRLLVAVLADPADQVKLKPLLKRNWDPEALAIGPRAAYLWCPSGVLASSLWAAVGNSLGDAVTSRNWTTISKLSTLLDESKREKA